MEEIIIKFQSITLSDLIALLALILASISFGWNVLNEIRNKPRAEVSVMIANMIQPGSGVKDKNDYLAISMVNIGKRPIKIKGIGYKAYKWWSLPKKFRQYVILPKQLPIILNESEDHTEMFPYKKEDFKKFSDALAETVIEIVKLRNEQGADLAAHISDSFAEVDFDELGSGAEQAEHEE